VATALSERLGVAVHFDTDVTTAALAEHRWGAAAGADSVCYLTVGTGIGAGLLVAGHPVHGLVHPEVGHLRIPHDRGRDPFDGACPAHGDCWEGLAAGGAIAQRWGAKPPELPDDHPAWALEAEYVALGILAIVLVASPQRIVVGGGVMARPGLLDAVRERLVDLNAGYLETPMMGEAIDRYVVAPALGERAGVLGAIVLAQSWSG
jgi:fructokinase